jgi:glycosyltransferase involved in cell wall biosynthesis
MPFSTFNLCSGLIRAGADLRVVTTDCNGATRLDVPTDCWTAYDGIPVWYAKSRGGPLLYAPSATKAVSEWMPQADCVIDSGTLWSHLGFVSWRAARKQRTPSLTYVRGLLDPWAFNYKPVRKRVYWHLVGKRILRDTTAIVALSESEKQVIRALNVANRIEVIPNGAALDGDPGLSPRSVIDSRIPALSGRRYVLFLGRIHAKKGLDLLMRAVAAFRSEAADIAFVVAGPVDPGYAAEWQRLLHAHSPDGSVIVPGAVEGALKTALLRHAELFVLPSYSEGLPVAVLEALHAGCPVVITRACNLPEVEDAHAGLVIDPDAGQLLNAIRTLLRDDERRQAMRANAQDLARREFDWGVIAERTLRLCRDVAGRE